MVTKEDVEKAKAAAVYAAVADADKAWDKYIKLKEAFENGS